MSRYDPTAAQLDLLRSMKAAPVRLLDGTLGAIGGTGVGQALGYSPVPAYPGTDKLMRRLGGTAAAFTGSGPVGLRHLQGQLMADAVSVGRHSRLVAPVELANRVRALKHLGVGLGIYGLSRLAKRLVSD